ncbi:MAG: 2-oxoisovalerate dehydrogenase E1 component beta subunit [Myxococcota bacterium]|jgi:2-oxoisovalerate dehydrogenase E1 component beta subunit
MTGLAIGLALSGQVPVIELSSTHRLIAVAEALVHIASITADTAFSPTLVIRVPYGQQAGPTVDLPIGSVALPGVRVVCARSPDAATQLLATALATPGPTVLLEPRDSLSMLPGLNTGGCDVVRSGSHMTIVAWGAEVSVAAQAADQLSAEGLHAEVIDAVCVAPLDITGLCASVRKTGRLIVLHPNDSQLSNNVVQAVVEGAFLYLEAPPARATTLHQVVAAAREAATW